MKRKSLLMVLIFVLYSVFVYGEEDFISSEMQNLGISNEVFQKIQNLPQFSTENMKKLEDYMKTERKKGELTYTQIIDLNTKTVKILSKDNRELYSDDIPTELGTNRGKKFDNIVIKTNWKRNNGKPISLIEARYYLSKKLILKTIMESKEKKEIPYEYTEKKIKEGKLEEFVKETSENIESTSIKTYDSNNKLLLTIMNSDEKMTTISEKDGSTIRAEIKYKNKANLAGEYKVYIDDLLFMESEVVEGMPVGNVKYYHPNGKISMEGEVKNGEPNGVFKEYDEDGNLIEETIYENGEIIEEREIPVKK